MFTDKSLSFIKMDIFVCVGLLTVANGCMYENIRVVRRNASNESSISTLEQLEPVSEARNSFRSQVYELQCGLLRYYDTSIVPRHTNEVIKIDITFHLTSLLRFDEREETLITAAWLSISWQDKFLSWSDNPRYGNISELFMKQKQIWKPDILLMNTVEHFKILGADDLTVRITDDGRVEWEPGQRFKTACSLNINMYPFDSQECLLIFGTWMHVDKIISMSSLSDRVEFDHFVENGEWNIVSTRTESIIIEGDGYGAPTFLVTITLQRRRMYYVLTVCVPIIVLSILNCLVYLLPPASGEKISFCLTILLAYMVYISFLSDNLPRTSKTSSYLVIYLSLMICLSFLSVTNSVIVLIFWHRADEDKHIDYDKADRDEKTISGERKKSGQRNLDYVLYDDLNESTNITHKAGNMNAREIQTHTKCKNIAKRLDRILFGVMSALTLLITAVVLGLLNS